MSSFRHFAVPAVNHSAFCVLVLEFPFRPFRPSIIDVSAISAVSDPKRSETKEIPETTKYTMIHGRNEFSDKKAMPNPKYACFGVRNGPKRDLLIP